VALCCWACGATPVQAYSVFTHEQLIDISWRDLIQPLLLARYPHATAADLLRAHSYAYGGCAIQDLGYYPFEGDFFSDLTHYVRTADFISALFRDSQNVNEYAFAIGALTHYVGDTTGHREAVNRATALGFPKLARKYGSLVTYDESPHAHVRVEFAFDVGELSKHRLAPSAYLRYIGLRVPRRLLGQAFAETYGIPLTGILGSSRPAIHGYRFAVRSLLPRVAYAETVLHRHDFPPDPANSEAQAFLDRVAHADFKTVWEPYRKRHPTFLTYLVAGAIFITPKIGAASELAIKIPDDHTESLYMASVNRTIDASEALLRGLTTGQAGTLRGLVNRDLDTGEQTKPGAYALTDKTYARLVHELVDRSETSVSPALRDNILQYYSDPNAPISTKRNRKAWRRLTEDLERLKQLPAGGPPASDTDQ
jgi:hypothetical protein